MEAVVEDIENVHLSELHAEHNSVEGGVGAGVTPLSFFMPSSMIADSATRAQTRRCKRPRSPLPAKSTHISRDQSENSSVGVTEDDDGDLVVRRKKKNRCFQTSNLCRVNLTIKHASSATSLDLVGHQIWRASLYLGDYLLSNCDFFRNKSILELGAGTGISSLIAGLVVNEGQIIATDYDDTVLELCESNISENKQQGVVKVRAIDWMDVCWETNSTKFQLRDAADGKFGWTEFEQHELRNVDVILCADCVYDDNLTDALFRVLEKIMPATAVLYAALEKRFNFCLSAMDEVANGHNNFCSKFATETSSHDGYHENRGKGCNRFPSSFFGKVVPPDTFDQHLQYLRTADLELWEIRRR